MHPKSYYTTERVNPNPFGNDEVGDLIRELGSHSRNKRNRAFADLVDIGERAFIPVLKASYCNNSTIKRKLCDFFGYYRNPNGVIPLIRLLSDPNYGVRRSAAYALIMIGDERAVMPLIEALDDPEYEVRAHSIEALGMIGDERAVTALEKFLDDNTLSKEAMDSIKKMGTAGERAISRYYKRKEDEKREKDEALKRKMAVEERIRQKEEERRVKEAEKERIEMEERYEREMEKMHINAAGEKLRREYEKDRTKEFEEIIDGYDGGYSYGEEVKYYQKRPYNNMLKNVMGPSISEISREFLNNFILNSHQREKDRLCPSCGYLMMYNERDGFWYCDICGYRE